MVSKLPLQTLLVASQVSGALHDNVAVHLQALDDASQSVPVVKPVQEARSDVHLHSPFPPFPAELQ